MYNNRTCVKKAEGNVRGALKNCEKSLTIMLHLNMLDQLPTCYLNVCALYSTLGLHSEALKHAFLALQILRELIKDTHGKVWDQGIASPRSLRILACITKLSGHSLCVLVSHLVGQCAKKNCVGCNAMRCIPCRLMLK